MSGPTEVDQLLGMLDESNSSSLDDLLDNPAALDVQNVDAQDARRLQQVVKMTSLSQLSRTLQQTLKWLKLF